MKWEEVPDKVLRLYGIVAEWCFDHAVEFDLMVVLSVITTCVYVMRRNRRQRRRMHRFLWGTLMKRQDREKYQKMVFEDALTDAAMEMVHRGDMTDKEEAFYFRFFAEKLELAGLKPQKNVKGGVRARLKKRFGLNLVNWPGAKPGVLVDKTYNPNALEAEGMSKSRYHKEKE